MTQELIGELYRRYMRGELSLEDTAAQIFGLIREGAGFSVATSGMDPADQERTFALFGRLKWHTLRHVSPRADIPPMSAQEFLADLDELERGNSIE